MQRNWPNDRVQQVVAAAKILRARVNPHLNILGRNLLDDSFTGTRRRHGRLLCPRLRGLLRLTGLLLRPLRLSLPLAPGSVDLNRLRLGLLEAVLFDVFRRGRLLWLRIRIHRLPIVIASFKR